MNCFIRVVFKLISIFFNGSYTVNKAKQYSLTHVFALLKLSNGFTENESEKTLNEKGIVLTIIINDAAWRNVKGLVLVEAWLNERGCWL